MRRVEVVPPDPQWPIAFAAAADQVAIALGDAIVAIHHIGSTAIPGIYAKPIIDLLVVVTDLPPVDARTAAMEALGYAALGEFGIPGRRYFRRETADGTRTHHVHSFVTGSPEIHRHLVFRDYMRAHPAAAQAYSDLKRQLAQQFPTDIERYMDGKDPFIKTMEQKALQWYAPQVHSQHGHFT